MKKRTAKKLIGLLIVTYAIIIMASVYLWKTNKADKDAETITLSEADASDNVGLGDNIEKSDSEYGEEESNRKEDEGKEPNNSKPREDTVDPNHIETQEDPLEKVEEDKTEPSPKNENLQLTFVGDVYIGNYVSSVYESKKISGILSEKLLHHIENADLAMVNQEFPFSLRGTPMENKQYTFRVDPKKIELLQDMGIDVVSLANNHTLDYGVDALMDSFDTLDQGDIIYSGAGRNLNEAKTTRYFNMKGKKVAVLSASRVIPVGEWSATNQKPGLFSAYDPTALVQEIKEAKKQADIVIVYLHWGIEKVEYPKQYQHDDGKKYIDAGADIVIGSHPHVLQGIEYYKGKPIVYSLGNFIFSQTIQQTMLMLVDIDENNEMSLQLVPCKTVNGKTQELTKEQEIQEFYQYISKISFGATVDSTGIVKVIQQ